MPSHNASSSKKRKPSTATIDHSVTKKARGELPQSASPSGTIPLEPHEAVLAELTPKYDVLTASIISSTKIQSRVTRAMQHLTGHRLTRDDSATSKPLPAVVLLHTRPHEVCKMITVAENVKRTLAAQGSPWYQYNRLFAVPNTGKLRGVVEDTVLEKLQDGAEPGSDDFTATESISATTETRFERAILPREPDRLVMSLSIYLATAPVSELKVMGDVTLQSSSPASGSGE